MDRTAVSQLPFLVLLALALALVACHRGTAPRYAMLADARAPFAVEEVRYCPVNWSWSDEDAVPVLTDGVLEACGVALDATSLRLIGRVVRPLESDLQCTLRAPDDALTPGYWIEAVEPYDADLGDHRAAVTVGRGSEELWTRDLPSPLRWIVDPHSGAAAVLQQTQEFPEARELLLINAEGRVVETIRRLPDQTLVLELYDFRAGRVLLGVGTEDSEDAQLVLLHPFENSSRYVEPIPTPYPPDSARLVGERFLVFDGSLLVLSRGAAPRPRAEWSPPPLESLGFVRLEPEGGRFVSNDGRTWTADPSDLVRYVRDDHSVTITTSPAQELANFSGDLEWATAALIRFVRWERRWARLYRDEAGRRVVQAFTTGDDCAPSHARMMLRDLGTSIEIWREDLDDETARGLDEVGFEPETLPPSEALPPIPSDAVEVPLSLGPAYDHCVPYGGRPDAE